MAVEENDLCIKPEAYLTIWRYISLEKFESLLKNKALFFCRADRFSDPYEGSIPMIEAEYRIDESKRIEAFYGNEFDPIEAQKKIEHSAILHRTFKKAYY